MSRLKKKVIVAYIYICLYVRLLFFSKKSETLLKQLLRLIFGKFLEITSRLNRLLLA